MRVLYAGTLSILALFLLNSCNNKGSSNDVKDFEGGNNVVRIAEVTAPSSIFPHKLTNVVEVLIASQIHEGLVKINPKDLTIMPGLAEKWEILPDGKTIRFNLRKGVKFQKSQHEITSEDVKFSFELLCTFRAENFHFGTVCKDRILGANEFYEASKNNQKIELKGFKIIDDHSFSIELLNSPHIFLEILSNPVASILNKDSYDEKLENCCLGAGPFILDEKNSSKTRYALYKNIHYYRMDKDGKAMPYIDSLIIDIVPTSEDALIGFQSGKYDLIMTVPGSQLKDIVEQNIREFKSSPPRYIIDQRPEMTSAYYLFNIKQKPFDNIKVRQAFNYAIDRNRIIDRVLFGQAYGPAIHGVVPPTFGFYDINKIEGYDLNIEKAKSLLKEAGYPDGKNFPEIQLYVNSGNTRNNTVAAEIQKQLKNHLNVNITFESLPNGEKFDLQLRGKGNMYRDGWVADYPSPESFLSIFYGELVTNDTTDTSYPNTIKYKNAEYDKYYKMGRDASNRDSAAVHFAKAEQILIKDAPLIPLWYESNYRLISSRLKNFHSNPLRYYDFSQVMTTENK
jgi:oligopeptide transport system substrate-binding protein